MENKTKEIDKTYNFVFNGIDNTIVKDYILNNLRIVENNTILEEEDLIEEFKKQLDIDREQKAKDSVLNFIKNKWGGIKWMNTQQ